MPIDKSKLPQHIQDQIADAGQVLDQNDVQVQGEVLAESGPPTDWQRPDHNKLPAPEHVEPTQPDPQQPEQEH